MMHALVPPPATQRAMSVSMAVQHRRVPFNPVTQEDFVAECMILVGRHDEHERLKL